MMGAITGQTHLIFSVHVKNSIFVFHIYTQKEMDCEFASLNFSASNVSNSALYFSMFLKNSELLTWHKLRCRNFEEKPQISTWIYGHCLIYRITNFTHILITSLVCERI